jgi:hypothetical protein
VIKTLLEIPLWEIAKLDEPVGKGDKKILREVCTFFYFGRKMLHYIFFFANDVTLYLNLHCKSRYTS